jgi:Flp pilus assembly protein TadG
MLYRLCRSYREQRRGAAAVEFAVVAPVFILLVLGMLEYGRMIMVQQVITNASREGARRAVLDGATVESVTAAMTSYGGHRNHREGKRGLQQGAVVAVHDVSRSGEIRGHHDHA